MKWIIAFSIAIAWGVMAFAQDSPVDKVFDKYSGEDGYTTVYISSFMFNLMSNIDSDDPEFDEFQNFTSEAFASLLSEARKYGLSIVLSHQFGSQLKEYCGDGSLYA